MCFHYCLVSSLDLAANHQVWPPGLHRRLGFSARDLPSCSLLHFSWFFHSASIPVCPLPLVVFPHSFSFACFYCSSLFASSRVSYHCSSLLRSRLGSGHGSVFCFPLPSFRPFCALSCPCLWGDRIMLLKLHLAITRWGDFPLSVLRPSCTTSPRASSSHSDTGTGQTSSRASLGLTLSPPRTGASEAKHMK